MAKKLTEHDARNALHDHLVDKATAARTRHGPRFDDDAIRRLLADPEVLRYPTGVRFDTLGLEPGEFAAAVPLGDHPSRGYCILVHPRYEHDPILPLLIAYHIPPINYGDIAGPEDCEQFGATLMGMSVDDYYQALCDVADALKPAGGTP